MKSLGILAVLVLLAFVIGATGAPGAALETAVGWLLSDQVPPGLVTPEAPDPA